MEQNINNKKRMAKTKSNSGKSGKILYDKPAIAIPAQIAPFTLRLCPDTTDNTPTFIDKSHYRITYIVDNNKIYTLKLGIGISSSGVAAMSKDTIIVFRIPIMPDRLQNVISLAYINELYSAKYKDSVWLKARKNQYFRVEYVLGSIAVESNNGLQVFPLDNNSIKTKDNTIIICQNGISDKIPNCCTFFFDFLQVQIKIIYV